MSKLETLLYDESLADVALDTNDVVEEMLNHKDIEVLCELAARGVLSGNEALEMLETIYLDAASRVKEAHHE